MDCSGTLSRTLPRNLFEKRFVGTSKNFQKEFGIHSFRSTVCRPFQDSKNCSMRIPPHYSFRKDQSFDSFFLLNYLFVSSFCFIRFSMTIWKIFHFLARHSGLVGSSGLEPPTSRLSGARSNLLSYEPMFFGSLPTFPPCPQNSLGAIHAPVSPSLGLILAPVRPSLGFHPGTSLTLHSL